MASSHDTAYQARFQLPDLYERGVAGTGKCPVYLDGALVAPSSGTVSVYYGGTAVLDGASVTVTGSVATYAWTPAATLTLSDRYVIEWSLVFGGVTYVFRNDAAVVRRRLYCPVTDADLYRVVPDLDPGKAEGTGIGVGYADYSEFLDEAWVQIQHRLIHKGQRPYLVMSPSSLRGCALYLTLALVFDSLTTDEAGTYALMATKYRDMYEAEWSRVSFVYDTDDDGTPETHRRSPVQMLTLAVPRRRW